ncbi:transmembrane protein, putative (macronuclear) [Tetrahymena thermophila SB210]|uniref:Transmembrane protein, putative n=1 Tax=Tetrahymena thermophila (strain SB210) TaxID=312017 RepID=I7M8Q1_TETTS|nr:transmembrane protein, putative [Tetrahymena thermophila SB210]EAR99447.2 transmembrane protein, putative [Tetrahymena thermophila SB210]|eukprot:XP_001019692.2 transmembrane protein, putative [Tetrahymena thermophila SB210]
MGFKIKSFKYVLLPIFMISVIKIVLFYFVAYGITNIVLNYKNYIYISDESIQQLTIEAGDQIETFFNRHYNTLFQIKNKAENIAIQNYKQSPTSLQTYTSNVLDVDNNGPTIILGYNQSTQQSVKAFLWCSSASQTDIQISQLNPQQQQQVTNNYLRIFELIRPVYVGYQAFISDIIIYSEFTKMYMRFPAKKGNQFSGNAGYDFSKTPYYQNVKSNYLNNNKDLTFISFSSQTQEAQYLCIVIEIDIQCQNNFCGTACIILKQNFNEFQRWVMYQQKIYQNLDKLFIILRASQIIFTSPTLPNSTSSQLLPLSQEINTIVTNYNTMRGSLLINQTEDAWIACDSVNINYQSNQLGYITLCSISSKKQIKTPFNNFSDKEFTYMYEYPTYIYIFNLVLAYIIIYRTFLNFINPLKDCKSKIKMICEDNLELTIPINTKYSIKEVKEFYDSLSFLYDCLRFSMDKYYKNEEDSVKLIRLCSALKHFQKLNYLKGIIIANNNIGLIHIQNQRYKQAIISFKKSLEIVEDKMIQLIGGYPLEQFYNVKPEKGWKYLAEDKNEELMQENGELIIDLENIPESIMKCDTVESFFDQILNRDQIQHPKKKDNKNDKHSGESSYNTMKIDRQYSMMKNNNRQKFEIFNGIPSKPYSTPIKAIQMQQFNILKPKNIQNTKIKISKKNYNILKQKLEPIYIDRCNQLANAYCIYAFDIKKTDRKQAKRLAEKAIEKYKIVSRLFKNIEPVPDILKRHFIVIIRLISLYLECADFNKFVDRTPDLGETEFNKSYDAYNEAQKILQQYEQMGGNQGNKDILNQVHHFYIFLYLKGAGLYSDAYEYFQKCIKKYKYYDPAIRYSYLTHVKQILEKFYPKMPKSLIDMIQGFKVRKNKDIAFVINFSQQVELKKKKKKKQFQNAREMIAQVFWKIYDSYIEANDRMACILMRKQIDVIFELKYKHNNEKYFRSSMEQNLTINENPQAQDKKKINEESDLNLKSKENYIDQEAQNLTESGKNDTSEQPTFRKLCRSIYTARKLFYKVEDRKNLKWIVVLTDNLDNTIESDSQKQKYCRLLKKSLEQSMNTQKNENEEQTDLVNLMIIGLDLDQNTKMLFKPLCQVTQEGIFIEDCNIDDINIAFQSISNISHLFGGAAGSTGVSIKDFQKEKFRESQISDEIFEVEEKLKP